MLAERLKKLRLEANLTQSQLAEKLNMKQQSYARWENSKSKPNREKLQQLSTFFHVSTDYLLGNTDIKNSAELSDTDLLDILESDSASYDGKPLTEKDKETLLQVLKDYFDGTLEAND